MVTYVLLYGIFICLAIAGITSIGRKESLLFYVGTAILLILIAGLRGENVDRDYKNYSLLYDNFDTLSLLLTEPTFVFFSWIVRVVYNNIVGLFFIYAILGVSIKLYAIRQLSEQSFLSELLYLSTFFLLHEMTQIRAGIASGIFLLSIKPIFDKKLFLFFLLTLLAIVFHYSSFIILPIYFLSSQKINIKAWSFVIIAVYVLHFYNIHFTSILEHLPLQNVQYKLEANKEVMLINEDKIQVFNVLQTIRLGLCFFLLYNIEFLQKENKYSILLLKIYILSLCSMVVFSDIPTFAVRISEFFGVVEIVLLPFLVYIILPQKISAILVVLIALLFISTNLFYTKLLLFK